MGSYNVNGKKPPPGLKVSDWLSSLKEGSGGSGGGYADIIVLGFQEVVPLSAGNVIVGESWGTGRRVSLQSTHLGPGMKLHLSASACFETFLAVLHVSLDVCLAGSASTNIDAWDRAVAAELNGEQWYACTTVTLLTETALVLPRRCGGPCAAGALQWQYVEFL